MKKVKCFVLSLFLCFSFGCGPSAQQSKTDLELLLKSINNIESYQCVRSDMDYPFLCTLNIINQSPKLIICGNNGCIMKKCPIDYLCFQDKIDNNDTE